jgi:glycine cleavage system protein P-like pyridoxal-binding family
MITVPNTLGVFESEITAMAGIADRSTKAAAPLPSAHATALLD